MKDWFDKALCKGSDSSLYYDGFYSLDKNQKQAIIAKCEACPVLQECYTWAVDNKEHGIWGGRDFAAGRARNPLRRKVADEREFVSTNVA